MLSPEKYENPLVQACTQLISPTHMPRLIIIWRRQHHKLAVARDYILWLVTPARRYIGEMETRFKKGD